MKIIFFGTSSFAVEVLKALISGGVEVAAVVTREDKPRGRSGKPLPSDVGAWFQQSNLYRPAKASPLDEDTSQQSNLYRPAKASSLEFAKELSKYNADLFIVVAYGEILRRNILEIPKLGCVNVHASLLPKYRGAAPIQRCLMNGEDITGVSIMYMTEKMDAGDVIRQETIKINKEMTFQDLESQLYILGSQTLLQAIEDIDKDKEQKTPQNHPQATYAKKITLEDCYINWNTTAENIHNLVRALYPKPSAWCNIFVRGEKKRLKIHKSKVSFEEQGIPGEILSYEKHKFVVGCGQNSLEILELQLEGRKKLLQSAFIQGFNKKDLSFVDFQ